MEVASAIVMLHAAICQMMSYRLPRSCAKDSPLPSAQLLQVVMFDSYGGIINPMTGQLLAQLPSLGSQIHFEAMYSGSYAPLMMTYENNYTVVELFIIGEWMWSHTVC